MSKIILCGVLAAYILLLWWRPSAWLFVVPALLPVLDLAPWTGWFFFDELDLLLLATAMVGYARRGPSAPRAALSPVFKMLIVLLALVTTISAVIGLLPWTTPDASSFATYSSPFNSLRVAKGSWWALLLLPLLREGAGPDLAGLRRYLFPGMLAGLALASAAVVWERAVFPGLSNFASDYRPTAPFSAMHTGGAALDAYLALSFPFVAGALLLARSLWQRVLATLLFLLGCYAGLSLFSRDIYLAYGLTAAILGGFVIMRGQRKQHFGAGAIAGAVLGLAVTGFVLHRAFDTGGYRLLGCALVLLGAAVVLAGAPLRLRQRTACAALALALCLLMMALFKTVDKGAYIAFIVASVLCAGGVLALHCGPAAARAFGLLLAMAAFPAMALAGCLVGLHWGGDGAGLDGAVVAVWALTLLAAARLVPARPLPIGQHALTAAMVCVIGFATVIPITSSYYLGSRWATTSDDLGVRLRHWSEAIGMMDSGLDTTLFGMGLGRYPAVYALRNTHGEIPSTMRYARFDGRSMVELGAARYDINYGEVLRLLQHVPLEAGKSYHFQADVRHRGEGGALYIGLCERWLIYPQNCISIPAKLDAPAETWQHLEATVLAKDLGGAGWLAPPVQLELSADGGGTSLMLTGLSLRDNITGAELLRNGDFAEANTHWFFSSDRNHFPWHIKNVAVNSLFEQGWIGSAVLLLFLVYLGGLLLRRCIENDAQGAVLLAALASFLITGLFDSLFDVPRLTLAFFLVAYSAGLRPARRRRSASVAPGMHTV